MENSGESGDDTGPLGHPSFLSGNGVATSYIGVQSDDLEGRLSVFTDKFRAQTIVLRINTSPLIFKTYFVYKIKQNSMFNRLYYHGFTFVLNNELTSFNVAWKYCLIQDHTYVVLVVF